MTAVTTLACSAVAIAGGASGLDPSFGTGGVVIHQVGDDDWVAALAVQPDRKIAIVAVTEHDVDMPTEHRTSTLMRYLPDGTLDASFGDGGRVVVRDALAATIALQRDGRIVVAGAGRGSTGQDVFVRRYWTDGRPDRGFGRDGVVLTDFGPARRDGDRANDVEVQRDGRIVVAGDTAWRRNSALVLARYRADGRLDRTFGSGGKVTTPFGGKGAYVNAVEVRADGKIVAVGGTADADAHAFVARYLRDGRLDRGFGSRGRVSLALAAGGSSWLPGGGGRALALQSGGRILLGGKRRGDFALVRLTDRGRLDATFGRAGRVRTDVGRPDAALLALALAAGRIRAVGYTDSVGSSNGDVAVVGYHANGSRDESAGVGGIARVTLPEPGRATEIAVEPGGRLVIGGSMLEPDPQLREELAGDPRRGDAAFGPSDLLLARLLVRPRARSLVN